jgi:hypothetical protein
MTTPPPIDDPLTCRDCGRRLRGARQLLRCGRCSHARQPAGPPKRERNQERDPWLGRDTDDRRW